MKIEKIKISDLKEYENNAKLHPREQVEQIKKSIQEFGFNDPIAVDENNMIIEGHGRLYALKELGYDEVECIRLTHLSEEQKKAYILAHNKLTMNTDFDLSILEEELDNIINIDMSDFGFDIITDEFSTDFTLKDGDREPIQTMSITFSDDQIETVNEALKLMKGENTYKDYDGINKNSNGNAMYLIILEWLEQKI